MSQKQEGDVLRQAEYGDPIIIEDGSSVHAKSKRALKFVQGKHTEQSELLGVTVIDQFGDSHPVRRPITKIVITAKNDNNSDTITAEPGVSTEPKPITIITVSNNHQGDGNQKISNYTMTQVDITGAIGTFTINNPTAVYLQIHK